MNPAWIEFATRLQTNPNTIICNSGRVQERTPRTYKERANIHAIVQLISRMAQSGNHLFFNTAASTTASDIPSERKAKVIYEATKSLQAMTLNATQAIINRLKHKRDHLRLSHCKFSPTRAIKQRNYQKLVNSLESSQTAFINQYTPPQPIETISIPPRTYRTLDDCIHLLDSYGFGELNLGYKTNLALYMTRNPLHLKQSGIIATGDETKAFNTLLKKFALSSPDRDILFRKYPDIANFETEEMQTSIIPLAFLIDAFNTTQKTVVMSSRESVSKALCEIGLDTHLNPEELISLTIFVASESLELVMAPSFISSRSNKEAFIGCFFRYLIHTRLPYGNVKIDDWSDIDRFYQNKGLRFSEILAQHPFS